MMVTAPALALLMAASPAWWMLPKDLAYDEEVINLIDRASIEEMSPGVTQVTIAVVLRTRGTRASYLLGRREYSCEKFEYRDLWVRPMNEGEEPKAERDEPSSKGWRDAEAGTANGVIGAMTCGAFENWREQGFRRVGSIENARAAIDRETSV